MLENAMNIENLAVLIDKKIHSIKFVSELVEERYFPKLFSGRGPWLLRGISQWRQGNDAIFFLDTQHGFQLVLVECAYPARAEALVRRREDQVLECYPYIK